MTRRAERDAAYAEFVSARQGHFRRVAYALCGDWDRAEDLLQVALVKLYLAWPRVRRTGSEDAYLRRIERTTRILAKEGIWVLLDFHQDLYHERFQGEGAPTWAVQDDGLPAEPQLGFPANYFVMPGLNRAFDNFWANSPGPGGVGLQDRYAAAWAHVAAYFSGTRRCSVSTCSTSRGPAPAGRRAPTRSAARSSTRGCRRSASVA